MKKITKLLLLVAICTITVNSNAQTFRVTGGLNLSTMTIDDFGADKKLDLGIHLGVAYEYTLSDILSVEAGLGYSIKGVRFVEKEDDYKYVGSIKMNYLELPVLVKYNYSINEEMTVFGAAGPYLGYCLSGKSKGKETYDGDTDSYSESLDIGFDEDENDLKPLDFGLTIGGGMSMGVIQVGLYYDLGLLNISHYDEEDVKNRVIRLSASYSF